MKGDKIKYWEGYKYLLAADYVLLTPIKPKVAIDRAFVSLSMDGLLTIKDGYAWDGPSGPTIDTKNSMRGSLVHDALYQLMREELLSVRNRPEVDDFFYQILLEDGMWRVRAWFWKRAVREKAAFAASAEYEDQIITAP